MECPKCGRPARPGAKICVYCGNKLPETGDPRVERGAGRDRGPGRGTRYDDDPDARYEPDDDDEYGGRRPRAEPPARGSRPQGRGRGIPEWDDPPPGVDDSSEAPAYDRRSSRGADRAGGYGGAPGRGGRGYDADEDEHDDDSAYDDAMPRAPRPSQRRPEERLDRGSRPADDRFDDPLDDPRAPGFLRGGAAPRDVGRSPASSTRNGRGPSYDGRDGYGEPGGGRRPPSTPGRQGWQDDDRYTEEPRRGGASGRYEPRGYGSGSRAPLRGTPSPRPDPLKDSWEMPDFPSAEGNAVGWTNESAAWSVPLSEEFSAAQPGVRGPAAGRNTRRPSGRVAPRGNEGQRGKLIALGVLLALLLIGGGVFVAPKLLSKGGSAPTTTIPSAFATYTPGPTPTPAANYTLFTSKRSAYILTYPQSWSETEQPASSGDNLDTFAGTGGLPIFDVEQATDFSGVSDQDVINGEVQSAEKADATATYTEDASAATTVAIGGEQWARREFNVTSQGVKYRMAILSCHHHGKGYVIVLATAPADFAKYNSGEFKTMLASFRFVG